MSDALAKARAIAAAATPAPWGAADGGSFGGWWISLNGDPSNVTIAAVPLKLADADHIATFDPPTVLAMLDAIEAIEGELIYKYTDDQRRINFPKTAHRLTRFYDLIGDDDE